MKKRNLLALLLAVSLLIVCFAGCGSSSDSSEETKEAEESSEEAAAVSEEEPAEEAEEQPAEEAAAEESSSGTVSYPITTEPLTLTCYWLWNTFMSSYNITQDIIDEIPTFIMAEEETGVHIDFDVVGEESYETNIQLLWASGDYRDMYFGAERYYSTGANGAVSDEVLLDLAPYLEEYMPDYNKVLLEQPDFAADLTSADGYIISVAEFQEYSDSGIMVRQDWLDELNLDVPTTMDEVLEVCRAFKENYGARNAVMWNADTSAFFGWSCFNVETPSGMDLPWQIAEDGVTVVSSLTEPGFKACLEWMHTAYEEGLCSDDFLSFGGFGFDDFIYDNEVGICYSNSNMLTTPDSDGAAMSGQESFALRAISDTMETAGEENRITSTVGGVGSSTISISAKSEHTIEAMEYLNWLYTDDGILVTNYGFEGEGFYYDENGKPCYGDIVLYNDTMPVYVATSVYTSLVGTPYYNSTERRMATFTTEAAQECIDVWSTGRTGVSAYHGKMTTEEDETYSAVANDIITSTSEQILRFITGERSLDEYDDFVAEMEDMGLSEVQALKQAAYDRYLAG